VTLHNLVEGETLSLSGSGQMADKHAGDGKEVALVSLALGDGDGGGLASNYTLVGGDHRVDIAKATITAVTGIAAVDREYDGTTSATLDVSGAVFAGMVAGDTLEVASATGAFATKDAGENKEVTISGIALGGADAGNYELASSTAMATATIAPRVVILRGSRVYDGTRDLAAGIFTLHNLVEGETLSLSGSGQMADKHAGDGKEVTLVSLALGDGDGGGLASNYTLVGGDHRVDIAKATITAVTGIAAEDKVYDGTTSATLDVSGAVFAGMVAGDTLKVASATGAFATKDAGENKEVTISGIVLGGVDAGNYELASSTSSTTATIAPRVVILRGSRVYDGTRDLAAGIFTLHNLVEGETLSLSGSGQMADKQAGDG